ncbi:MAG: cysteine desulfurase [Pirellulaceae bacterium]|nr:MAG: cysteine desulfurase [Pirellulaceae bacterium]
MTRRRVYLDNAATSWPKPPAVYEAVCRYMRDNGAAMGRGVYACAQEVGRTVAALRRRLARLLGVSHPERVLFAFNGTDALNIALHGVLRPGDHVVTTDTEHNSVLRPLRFLEKYRGIEVTYVACDECGRITAEAILAAVRDNTRLLAINHVSNVTGTIQPIHEILAKLGDHPALRLIDAAQSVGHLPLHFDQWKLDFLACSGHKGLLGPLGTGVLAVSQRAAEELLPFREGGTGSYSDHEEQPEVLPDRFESGNHNVPGLVGLERASAYVEERGVDALRKHELHLTGYLLQHFSEMPAVTVYGPATLEERVGVVSFSVAGFDPQELASLLDAEFAIEVRSGLHCAPRLHRRLGTLQRGGTVRVSFGPFNTPEDVDVLLKALHDAGRS